MVKTKIRKIIVLLSTVCILNTLAAGCGSRPESVTKTQGRQADDALAEDGGDSPIENNDAGKEKPQENVAGKWQVLDPEAAAAFDADFKGKVWKIAEDSFFIVETKVKILDDGSLTSSTPSSNANVPDSQLIQVVFDDDTYFCVRTIYGNGESYEDEEAGFQDLKEYMPVDMKGRFENDVFYATEIRLSNLESTGNGRKGNEAAEGSADRNLFVGIVEKYEENKITIKNLDDDMLLYFSTNNAQIVEGDSPITVGDKVEITYRGLLGDENSPGEAVKIVADTAQ